MPCDQGPTPNMDTGGEFAALGPCPREQRRIGACILTSRFGRQGEPSMYWQTPDGPGTSRPAEWRRQRFVPARTMAWRRMPLSLDWYPRPVERSHASTSASTRTVTCCFTGR
jgi:hypothetical protein